MPANVGTQTVSLKFFDGLTSVILNRVGLFLRKIGVYDGGYLTRTDDTHVSLSPLKCEIQDQNGTDDQVCVKTAAAVTVVVGAATPLVVLRWTYTGSSTVDYMDFVAIADGSQTAYDVVVGKCVFAGSTLTGFDYTSRTSPQIFERIGKVVQNDPTPNMKVRVRAFGINNGSRHFDIVDQESPLFVAPTSNPRKDYIYFDPITGSILVQTGVESATPAVPDYQGRNVLAEITLATSMTQILNANIKPVLSVFSSGSLGATRKTLVWVLPGGASTGTNVSARFKLNFSGVALKARAYAKTAPTGANIIFDIKKNGTSLWAVNTANKLKITAGNNEDTDATSFDTSTFAIDDAVTLDVNQVGSTVGGSDLTVELELAVA